MNRKKTIHHDCKRYTSQLVEVMQMFNKHKNWPARYNFLLKQLGGDVRAGGWDIVQFKINKLNAQDIFNEDDRKDLSQIVKTFSILCEFNIHMFPTKPKQYVRKSIPVTEDA